MMNSKNLKKLIVLSAGSMLALGILLFSLNGTVEAKGPSGKGNSGYQNNGLTGSGIGLVSTTPLSNEEQTALQQAILEEYKAMNLYQNVIDQFGSIVPFSSIARSEQQHVNSLVNQATKYGVEVPANPGLEDVVTLDSLSEACTAGVAAETEDAALYDDLMAVTTHSDLLRVYTILQNASLTNHLPAFQACE